jgi:hypothetical protein
MLHCIYIAYLFKFSLLSLPSGNFYNISPSNYKCIPGFSATVLHVLIHHNPLNITALKYQFSCKYATNFLIIHFSSFFTCYSSCFHFVPKQFQCLALDVSQICTRTKHKTVTMQHYFDTFTGSMAVIQHFIKHKRKIFNPTLLQNMQKMAIRACGIFNYT